MWQEKLKEAGYRKVTIEEGEWVPEEDSAGRKKVYELSQFRGVYRAGNGELVDLRPKETCPCFRNFMKKDLPVLYDLLVKAYESQLLDLKNSKYDEKKVEDEIKVKLTKTRS